MTSYVLSPRARGDLDSIWDYTVETWGSNQAERYLRAFEEACDALALGRKRGRSAEDIRSGYMKLAVGSHLVFYRTLPNGVIDVVRILHQSMDIPVQFTH